MTSRSPTAGLVIVCLVAACQETSVGRDAATDGGPGGPDASQGTDAEPPDLGFVELPPRAELDSHDRELVSALCAHGQDCAVIWGRQFADLGRCQAFFAQAILMWRTSGGGSVDAALVSACAADLGSAACPFDWWVLEPFPATSSCAAALSRWRGSERPTGAECGGELDCTAADTCALVESDGAECKRCSPRRLVGEACTDRSCEVELLCDQSLSEPVCAEPSSIDGRSCVDPEDCGERLRFLCGAAGRCEAIAHGTPCSADSDPCPWVGLRCIASRCVEAAAELDPCEEDEDCADGLRLGCEGGGCTEKRARTSSCTETRECLGHLACLGGQCDDAPGPNEPCSDRCTFGEVCAAGRCTAPDLLQQGTLVAGSTCAVSCGPACLSILGNCIDGYCDLGGNPPHSCRAYARVGEGCGDDSRCDPDRAYCESGPFPVCRALGREGAPCAPDAPCAASSYCDPSRRCAARKPDGETCTAESECAGGSCFGLCQGGPQAGLPCRMSIHCGGGQCVGRCGGPDRIWRACRE